MLRPWEWVQVYPIFSASNACPVLLALALLPFATSAVIPILVLGGLVALVLGSMFDDLNCGSIERKRRRQLVKQKRGMFGKKLDIQVEPIGETVQIVVRQRPSCKDGVMICKTRVFHAEDQAEAAHDFVAGIRANASEKDRATTEAKALAKALS